MKIITANGKRTLKLSRVEWENIGKTAGWKTASEEFEVTQQDVVQTG